MTDYKEIDKEWDKKFRDYFTDEWFICGKCGHPWESHYWNGGGRAEASGYDACHIDGCDCGYPEDKKTHSELRPSYKTFKSFLHEKLKEAEERGRRPSPPPRRRIHARFLPCCPLRRATSGFAWLMVGDKIGKK